MLNRMITLASLIALIVLMVMLNLTTPAAVGPFGVLVFFTMVYLVALGIATGLVGMWLMLTGNRGGMRRKEHAYAAVLALAPLMLLLVQAFGSLSLWTGALIAIMIALGCFLVNKRV